MLSIATTTNGEKTYLYDINQIKTAEGSVKSVPHPPIVLYADIATRSMTFLNWDLEGNAL